MPGPNGGASGAAPPATDNPPPTAATLAPTWFRQPWLWLVVGLYVALAAAYMAVIPPFEGFDVQAHFAAVNHYQARRALPELTGETLKTSYELIQQPPLYYVVAAVPAAVLGLPAESAAAYARRSNNLYFGGEKTYRQSVTLPTGDRAALASATIARVASLVGGLLAVLGTWWAARCVRPSRPAFAAAAVAVATLNPVFLYQSVTITNDAWAAGTCALAVACALEAWRSRWRPTRWLAVGALLGLCGLAKYSALLVVVPLGVLWLAYARRACLRAAAAALAWGAAGFAVVGGWWYARNLWLYGEVVPVERMGAVILGLYRQTSLPAADTLAYGPWFVSSFWGVFVALIAPGAYLELTRWFMAIGLAGVPLAIARDVRARRATSAALLAILAAWLLIVVMAVLQWARTVTVSVQAARLAFVAVSAFGVLMAAGWEAWLPGRARPMASRLIVIVMACLALSLLPFLRSAHALPPEVAAGTPTDRALPVSFEPGMRVLGVDLPEGAAIDAGGRMTVRIHFTADRRIEGDYTLFVHLADADDRLLFHYDGAPLSGLHPTRQWVPGEVFVDTYAIAPGVPITRGALATLSLGFYRLGQSDRRLDVLDPNGRRIGDRLVVGKVRLNATPRPDAAAQQTTPVAAWQNGIVLTSAELVRDAGLGPSDIKLTWSTTHPIDTDYTAFVHVLDTEGRLVAQVDGQPQDGTWPTSTWRPGDSIGDTRGFPISIDRPNKIVVGWYGPDGARIPPATPGETYADAVDLHLEP